MFVYHVKLVAVQKINGINRKKYEEFVVEAPDSEVAGKAAQVSSSYWGAEVDQVNRVNGILKISGLKSA